MAKEVAVRLRGEWTVLQSHLNIPDHIMLDVLHPRNLWQQVFRWVTWVTVLMLSQQYNGRGHWGQA